MWSGLQQLQYTAVHYREDVSVWVPTQRYTIHIFHAYIAEYCPLYCRFASCTFDRLTHKHFMLESCICIHIAAFVQLQERGPRANGCFRSSYLPPSKQPLGPDCLALRGNRLEVWPACDHGIYSHQIANEPTSLCLSQHGIWCITSTYVAGSGANQNRRVQGKNPFGLLPAVKTEGEFFSRSSPVACSCPCQTQAERCSASHTSLSAAPHLAK